MTVEDLAEIRRLYRSKKLSQAEIARRLKLSRNTAHHRKLYASKGTDVAAV